ncbi:MAG TPA: hypothetical protein VMF09_14655 [Solirubrobacteraceae bacterium]|nr:hypothetical protein [Solirubrobacteraceae bacterium]
MRDASGDWRLTNEDLLGGEGISSGDEAFTRIYIRYADPVTGEESVVHAEKNVENLPLLERIVPRQPPGAPLTKADAQELADEAAAVLAGIPISRYWVRIEADRPLAYRDGNMRPARLIQPRDSVAMSLHPGEVFYVFDVTAEADGTMAVSLADVDLDERLDVEVKLIALEHD